MGLTEHRSLLGGLTFDGPTHRLGLGFHHLARLRSLVRGCLGEAEENCLNVLLSVEGEVREHWPKRIISESQVV